MSDPQFPQPNIDPTALVAPGAHIYGDVTIGSSTFVLFGVVIRAELDRIEIGSETNIQDNSVLHCDEGVPAVLGDRVTVGHAAVIHGAIVADRSLIGIGARVLNNASVGEGAWIGAGAVVTEGTEIPAWTLALGIPAKPVRDLSPAEVAQANEGVEHYLQFEAAYRRIFSNPP